MAETTNGFDALLALADTIGMDTADRTPPHERDVVVNGVRIHLLDWGNAGAQPVVLVHGAALTAHTWDLVALALRSRYHCIAIDLRGHGDSEWVADADYRIDAIADDIEAVILQATDVDSVLIGMSLGGMAAMTVAGRGRVGLRGVVLVDIGPRPRTDGAADIRSFTREDRVLGSFDEFVDRAVAFNPSRRPEHLVTSLRHNLRELPDGRWTWKWDPRLVEGGQNDPVRREAELWAHAAHIDVPTLVVRGDRSRVFLAEDADELTRVLPNGRQVVVQGAGHTVQGDNPRGLVALLLPFLETVTQQDPRLFTVGPDGAG